VPNLQYSDGHIAAAKVVSSAHRVVAFRLCMPCHAILQVHCRLLCYKIDRQ
jgi:hypothetical protein